MINAPSPFRGTAAIRGMDGKRTYTPRHLRNEPSRMDNVRRRLMPASQDVIKWSLGAVAAEILVRAFDPELQELALLIRHLIGLR